VVNVADMAALTRAQTIYVARCAVCHGATGARDGPAAAALRGKPAPCADRARVASMTPAYWFWRVSEGAAVEPFRSTGSAMPAWKNELSVDDRWAVIAYQHALPGHGGRHDAAEHPELRTAERRPHPEPRAVVFRREWVTRDHRAQPRGPWRYAIQSELPALSRVQRDRLRPRASRRNAAQDAGC
jgi:mono/diheme cytochrome c family protein